MLVDAHCHLDPAVYGSDEAVDSVLARARDAGVGLFVAIGAGYGVEGIARARAVAERHADVWFTAGVHPHEASLWSDEVAAVIREAAVHPRCVAIGEAGLDFHYDLSPRDEQRAALRAQVRLAVEVGLPIMVHDRSAGDETLEILEEGGSFATGVMFHCYTGPVDRMQRIVRQGGYISIPGIVTFKSAGEMPDVARLTPFDRLLTETDSPYLAPVPFRGRQNEPRHVALVAAKIAELRGMGVDEVADGAVANARRLFRLPVSAV
jgi:TatD DNase family protein